VDKRYFENSLNVCSAISTTSIFIWNFQGKDTLNLHIAQDWFVSN